ncbi:hypothetical protein TDB9533_03708 [Thalassocella blandensis]|nr:hypothetical protein TDB9533_03708 [Thalassocella blandensis]
MIELIGLNPTIGIIGGFIGGLVYACMDLNRKFKELERSNKKLWIYANSLEEKLEKLEK